MAASPSSMKPSTSVWKPCKVAAASANSWLTLSRSATAALCRDSSGGSNEGREQARPVAPQPALPSCGDGGAGSVTGQGRHSCLVGLIVP